MTPEEVASAGPPRGWLASARSRAARLLVGSRGDVAWSLLTEGTSLVSSMLSFLLLGRTLGAAGYGAFVGLYALIGPFLALGQAGVFLAAMDHVARAREDPGAVVGSFLSLTAVASLVFVPLLSAVGLGTIEGLPPLAAVLLVGTEFLLNGVFSTSQAMVQVRAGFPAAARLRILLAASKIALLTGLAAAGSLTLTTLAVGQLATLGAISVLATAKASRQLGAPARPGRIHRRHVRSVLLYGLGIGASMAQNDGDKFVLNAAHHQGDAGRYGAAYRLMQIVMLPTFALASATHVSFLDGADGASAQRRRAIRLSLLALLYAVPAVVCLYLVAPLVPRILTRDFAETARILQLLAPVVLLRAVGVYPMNALMGLGRNGLRTALQLGNAALSLVLYVALIPRWSWQGALAATLVTEVSLCASGWIALLLHERSGATSKLVGEVAPCRSAGPRTASSPSRS
jgi:O-antigen/teichoic acid export membrane protein